MKIGVYVGSFNPVHKGHYAIASHLINKKYVDKIIFIPTANYWNKTSLIDLNYRIDMLKTYEDNNIIVNSKLNNLPYTYMILNELNKIYLNDDLYLIIGDDNLEKFHLWKNIEEIYKYNILVINRENKINNEVNKEKFTFVNDLDLIDISSTRIRENLNNQNYIEAKKDIDEKVLSYILNNKISFM